MKYFGPDQLYYFQLELGWVITFLVLGVIFVVLRVLVRWTATEHYWRLDDLLMVPALLVFVCLAAANISMTLFWSGSSVRTVSCWEVRLTFTIVHMMMDIFLSSDVSTDETRRLFVK